MPAAMIEQCEDQGLDWAEMALGTDDVEPAKPRDNERDVAKIKEHLSNELPRGIRTTAIAEPIVFDIFSQDLVSERIGESALHPHIAQPY